MSLEQYLNSENIKSSNDPLDAVQISSADQEIIESDIVEIRKFDDPLLDETIELHIYDTLGSYLTSDHTAEHWKNFTTDESFVQFDVYKNFVDLGITQGSYKFVLNFFRPLVGDSNNPNLYIKNISPDRTELLIKIGNDRIQSKSKDTKGLQVPGETITEQCAQLWTRRAEICGDNGYMNLLFMDFGRNVLQQFVNYRWLPEMRELYIKLYQPLPPDVKEKQKFWLVQQVRTPYTDNTVLYKAPLAAPSNTMKGPNWEIDVKYGKISETNYQNWNELLGSNVQTSQQIIDKLFSGSLGGSSLGIDYSGFQNFINYSSAAERIANFKYKVEMIEYYDQQQGTLNSISESNEVNTNKALYTKYKDQVIGGFDGFERYLYNEQTGSYYTHGVTGSNIHHAKWTVDPWPKEGYGKTHTDHPFVGNKYTLHHSTSSVAETWYNALHTSASLWDVHNRSSLIKSVPEHIREDKNNSEFETFVNMIGHHYDIMWTYIKHQTDVWNRDEHPAHGLSKDLLYDTAKSLGWHLVNGNQSERLFEYLLGTDELGNHGKINERVIDDELALYVPFDEGRPDFARQNYINYGKDPVNQQLEDYSKPPFVDGQHGWGAQFDGTHYLKYQKPIDFNSDDYAVSFWIKDLDATNATGTIFSAVSGSGPRAGMRVNVYQGTVEWNQYYTSSAAGANRHTAVLPSTTVNQFSSSYLDSAAHGNKSNGWTHLLINVDRDASATWYVNGTAQTGPGTQNVAISASVDIGQETIGDYARPIIGAFDFDNTGKPTKGLTGSLDELRVYTRKLATTEITDLYDLGSLYVTQSSANTFAEPREGLTHQVWRRIVNNLPHLLKTKGTSRSVKALLSCYGIPSSLLSIREYGGPKMEKTHPALIQDQFAYALQIPRGGYVRWTSNNVSHSIAGKDWGQPHLTPYPSGDDGIPPHTREIRFKPAVSESMQLWTMLDTNGAFKRGLNSVWLEYTSSYSGSSYYGRIHAGVAKDAAATPWLPIYDGNFWNLRQWFTTDSRSTSDRAYNTGNNTNVTYHIQTQQASDYVVGKIVHSGSATFKPNYVSHYHGWNASSQESAIMYLGGTGSIDVNGGYGLSAAMTTSMGIGTGSNADAKHIPPMFSGSIQEYREWTEVLDQPTFDKHTLNPKSYVSSLSPSSSFDTLVRHYPFGTNQVSFNHRATPFISSSHPAQHIKDFSPPSGSGGNTYASMSYVGTKMITKNAANNPWPSPTDTVNNDHYERVDETYYIHGPSIGGKNLKSEKIRLEQNRLVHPLSRETRGETSQYDSVSNDSNKLGIYFSPQDMINKDIFNQIGDVALDDFFGSAEDQYKDSYPRYKQFAHTYWKKYENDNDLNAYIRIFALFDFSFFQQIKQLIPVRTNADTGLIIEPSILERSKVMVEAQPSRKLLMYEDSIPDPFPDPVMSTLPLTSSIQTTEPLSGEPMHYTASIGNIWSGSAEIMHYTSSIPGKLYDISSDLSGSALSSVIDIKTSIVTSSFIPVYGISSRSLDLSDARGRSPISDPGLDIFGISAGHKGATYKHVGIVKSGSVWITSSRSELETSPTGSHIYEQRKSHHWKKKVFSYAPVDDVSNWWELEEQNQWGVKLNVRGRFIDRVNFLHMTRSIGASNGGNVTDSVNVARNYFKSTTAGGRANSGSLTHNYWTGNALVWNRLGNKDFSDKTVGMQTVSSDKPFGYTASLDGAHANKKSWSIAFILKEASGSQNHESVFMGRSFEVGSGGNFTGPTIGCGYTSAIKNYMKVRDNTGHCWYPNSASVAGKYSYPNDHSGSVNPITSRANVAHYVITYEGNRSTNSGSMRFYVNGHLHGGHDKPIAGHKESGSFSFQSFGNAYKSGATTYGFSGSLAQVRFYKKKLSGQEVTYLNKYPQKRANRDIDTITPSGHIRRGREIMTRRIRSNGWAPLTDIGLFATSHSLIAADYRDDAADSSYYEGSKLTAPNINEASSQTVDGEEVVKITVRNRYNLVYKKDLPGGGNLDVR